MEVATRRQGEDARLGEYDRLFEREGERMWRTLCAFTGGRTDIAEEAVAEAFARAMASPARIRDPLKWMYRVAFRVAVDEVRAERRIGEFGQPTPTAPLADHEELFEALRQLSPKQRAAIALRYEAELPIEEIARRLGITTATVRVHLHRARRRLRALLTHEEEADA
jgi:RNA polymerase sigma-70 factor (ECF subfamily)